MANFERMNYDPRTTRDHLRVRLLSVDCITLNSTWNAHDVRSPYWRLYLNSASGAYVSVSGREYALTPGQIHLIPAWVCFDCRNDAVLSHFFIHFDVVGWPPSLLRDVFPRPLSLARQPGQNAIYRALVTALSQNRHDEPETQSYAKAMVYLSLAQIITMNLHESRWEIFMRGSGTFTPALRYIESHLTEPIFNGNLAKLCFMSESHFIRSFRTVLGLSPAQYIRERRVSRGAEQLALTTHKLDDIAQRCGFANRYYFTRAFTAVMGVPPARYRAKAI